MTTRSRRHGWPARGIGLALGLALVGAGLLVWRVPRGDGVLGTDVLLASGPTGELGVTPSGPFLAASGLEPSGRAVEGTLLVRNQTGTELAVRLATAGPPGDLDRALWVEADTPRGGVFRGPLSDLAEGSGSFPVAPGEEVPVTMRVWLPAGASGYRGRAEEVRVELLSEAVGR